jgi:membrane-associated protease RseP (regulator of RpoE activity)
MVDFWIYDVGFLVIFTVFVTWFLYSQRKFLSREGIIFMYRTQAGVKAIGWFGDNFKKILHSLKYVIVAVGLFLMGAMIWMLGQTLSIYILHPEITKIIKAPPIAPLIPYFPKLFGMESFFPPFYFTYFIVALAIVAVVHEFSHGIFMKLSNVKIKSTGLVFLGPILGAFVEQDDKSFKKKKKFDQMAILGAGVFANIIIALLFYALYVTFFYSSFTASGYIFNSYGLAAVPLENITGSVEADGLTKITTMDGNYYLDENLVSQLNRSDVDFVVAYPEAPAVLARMRGAIIQADDVKIRGEDDLRIYLENKNPGDLATFITETNEGREEYEIILGNHPDNGSVAYLGVGHSQSEPRGFIQKILLKFMSFKDSSTYYTPTWDGDFVYFIYHLLWWIMIINLLVALFNMMPIGMLDGGRFFYLTILSITRSKKFSKAAFKTATYAILFAFLMLMFFWFVRII